MARRPYWKKRQIRPIRAVEDRRNGTPRYTLRHCLSKLTASLQRMIGVEPRINASPEYLVHPRMFQRRSIFCEDCFHRQSFNRTPCSAPAFGLGSVGSLEIKRQFPTATTSLLCSLQRWTDSQSVISANIGSRDSRNFLAFFFHRP
jgi:hypothetical protein